MALLAPKILRFQPSTTDDVVGYRVRIQPDGQAFDYDTPFEQIGIAADADGFIRTDLATFPGVSGFDGLYDVYVTSIDDNAPQPNESDPLEIPDATFDFSAPLAPTAGAIES